MTIRCPICLRDGYLVREKPRKLNRSSLTNWEIWKKAREKYPNLKDWEIKLKLQLYDSNVAHTEYKSENRTRSPYYRFFHRIACFRPCYLGSLSSALERIESSITKLNANKRQDWIDYCNIVRSKYPEDKKPKHSDAYEIYRVVCLSRDLERCLRSKEAISRKIEDMPRILVSDPTIKNPKS